MRLQGGLLAGALRYGRLHTPGSSGGLVPARLPGSKGTTSSGGSLRTDSENGLGHRCIEVCRDALDAERLHYLLAAGYLRL